MKDHIIARLTRIAYSVTTPYCYGCGTHALTGRCSRCGSDDLMRFMNLVGCDWGVDWVIKELVSEIEAVDAEARFENSMEDCYPETTQVGWLKVDTVSAIKDLDPISWQIATSEFMDSEESEEIIISFDHGGTYYETSSMLNYCEEKEAELGLESNAAS